MPGRVQGRGWQGCPGLGGTALHSEGGRACSWALGLRGQWSGNPAGPRWSTQVRIRTAVGHHPPPKTGTSRDLGRLGVGLPPHWPSTVPRHPLEQAAQKRTQTAPEALAKMCHYSQTLLPPLRSVPHAASRRTGKHCPQEAGSPPSSPKALPSKPRQQEEIPAPRLTLQGTGGQGGGHHWVTANP